jgi:outer membrane autotransporter protein
MEPNSIFEVEVDNSGNSDKLIVRGDVTIGGGTVKAISTETITGWHEYAIMEANSVSGTFAALDTALLHTGIVDPLMQLGYEIDSVLLRVVASHFDDPNVARTDNQRATGSALQRIADGGGDSITTAVQGLSSNGQVRAAYDQLCGSSRPPLSPVTVADTTKFMGTVSNRMHCARTGISYGTSSGPLFAMARPDNALGSSRMYDVSPSNYMFALGNGSRHFGDQNWGVWGKAYGLYGEREEDSGVPGYVYKVWGWSVGHDCRLTDELLIGVTGGFSDGYVDYAETSGRSDVDSKHIGFYSSYNSDGWYLDSVLTYGWASYETKRLVRLMGEQVEADFDGREISGYFEAGFDWHAGGGWLVQPLVSLQISYLDVEDYTETGGASALSYDDQTFRSYKASVGVRVAEEISTGADGLSSGAEVRARWVHEFGDVTSSVDAHFASNPGTVFTVSDGDVSRDSAILGVGYHAELSKQMRLFFDYDASVSGDHVIHVISGALEYRW